MEEVITSLFGNLFILLSCLAGLLFGVYNLVIVLSIDTTVTHSDEEKLIDKNKVQFETMNLIAKKIQDGAQTFLMAEYVYLGIFLVIFGLIVLISEKFQFYTCFAFLLGAITSLVSGYIGMYIATRANVRTTYQAYKFYGKQGVSEFKNAESESLKNAFVCAFRGGCVMGFILVALALAILTFLIMAYKSIIDPSDEEGYKKLFEAIAGYGLGGSTVALFCRVGGGIYTKAADVGADLVGKNLLGLDEDSPENPAVIADNVGDNVGDIAGMGSDLFGSFAESTCAALVISASSPELRYGHNFLFPLFISATGILACILTSFFATHIMVVDDKKKVESTLKWQIIISTIILTPVLIACCLTLLPSEISGLFSDGDLTKVTNVGVMICSLSGLWSGLIIGYVTDYYTSNAHSPCKNLANSCKSGAAINIIDGLALGYLSCIIPILALAATLYASFKLSGMYGISIAALGMLSNLALSLAIDAYGPVSDNAGGISEMSGLPKEIREVTDALDAAGNTTAAIGKGFAIGSACLVSLALFGAFAKRTEMRDVNVLLPISIATILIGAMMPYAFSALTMKSVGSAAAEMCQQVILQTSQGRNDPNECIRISTQASLKNMILPGILVIFTPLLIGLLFGEKAIGGYLIGVIVSGVQMAISSSNTGGAWDNAKKYIEAGNLLVTEDDIKQNKDLKDKKVFEKKSEPHKAAVVGDTVGDPLKDTSGPSLNILIKLSAIVSLVFGGVFKENHLFD